MKKTFIKILSVVLCVVMTLTAAPLGGLVGLDLPSLFDFKAEAASYSGECGTNLTWSLDSSTGVLNITGTGAMTNYTYSSNAPWYSYRGYIKTVNIGNSVTTIGDYAFYNCYSLTSVTIGNSVTTIGNYAFYNCGNLTRVTIPNSVTTIGIYAFYYCTNLTSVTIPDSVTTIGNYAFQYCTSLTNVTIPDSVTSIGMSAFYYCTSLTNVSIPDSVKTIGDYAFIWCASLTNITVDANNKYYSSDNDGVLFNKNKTTLIQYPIGKTRTSYTIPNGTTTIGDYAFTSCQNLTSVTISNSVTTIGKEAFWNCHNLTSVTIPNSVATINDGAFTCCYSLKTVIIPDSVTTINKAVFSCCESLTSITIPDSVTTIDVSAFACCYSLTSVTIPDSVTSIGKLAFSECTSLTSIIVDANNKHFSSNNEGVLFNKDKTTLIQYPAGNTRTSYTIPDSVTTIGQDTFSYCNSLTSVTIGNSVTTIDEGAFLYCDNLASVTIPDSVTSIGKGTFEGCTNLTSITIPDSVTTISDYAFYWCDNLTDVYFSGTQEQWKKISIGSDNLQLKNATIHYNSTGPHDVYIPSTQQHVVNNYKTANSAYAKMYLAGTAQPMDGSNGNPDLCIPGLKLGENMVPQGVAYYPAKNWLLISAYYNDGKNVTVPSAIFALDMATGEMAKEYRLYTTNDKSNKKAYTGHVGGIAVSDYNLYITSGSSIAYIPLSALDSGNKLIIKDKTDLSAYLNQADASYLSISDGLMFSGNFYYGSSTKYNKPAKDAKSVIIMQRLGGSNSEQEWAEVCDSAVKSVVNVPDSIDRIQGVAYRDRKFYISSSFGRDNNSTLYIADLGASTLKKITKFKALPMMEGLTFAGDYIYAVHESAAAFYREGLDGKGQSKDPTDVVWKIDYKQLIDPYNLGEETYSFKNYSDNHSNGHCFGMSMTSAAYHMGLLDITSIGGNIYDGLYTLSGSSIVKKPICYYQDIQGGYANNAIVAGGSYYKYWVRNIDSDWEAVVNYVKNHEYDNKGSLQIGYRQGMYGHAINFLRYEVVNGQERIYAYDNNFPNTEVYFYKDANGDILQAPYATFDGAIECIALRSVEKYFNGLKTYNAISYIFADKNDISIPGAVIYPLDCGVETEERVVFEIPYGKEKIIIVPLVENAEFEYLNVTYSFDKSAAGQVGKFVLAQDEATAENTVELTFIDLPEKIEIKTPSVTTVKYGDTLVLHADLGESVLSEGLSIRWDIDGAGFNMTPAEDGLTCNMTSVANGDATIKATIVDEYGDTVLDADGNEISDEITLNSNASFWQKIVSFFKNLFRMNRIIY